MQTSNDSNATCAGENGGICTCDENLARAMVPAPAMKASQTQPVSRLTRERVVKGGSILQAAIRAASEVDEIGESAADFKVSKLSSLRRLESDVTETPRSPREEASALRSGLDSDTEDEEDFDSSGTLKPPKLLRSPTKLEDIKARGHPAHLDIEQPAYPVATMCDDRCESRTCLGCHQPPASHEAFENRITALLPQREHVRFYDEPRRYVPGTTPVYVLLGKRAHCVGHSHELPLKIDEKDVVEFENDAKKHTGNLWLCQPCFEKRTSHPILGVVCSECKKGYQNISLYEPHGKNCAVTMTLAGNVPLKDAEPTRWLYNGACTLGFGDHVRIGDAKKWCHRLLCDACVQRLVDQEILVNTLSPMSSNTPATFIGMSTLNEPDAEALFTRTLVEADVTADIRAIAAGEWMPAPTA